MKPTRFSFENNRTEEDLQTREEYAQKTREMILSESRNLAAKIKGSSLSNLEKQILFKDSITILLNSL